jgi:hypothetical protein
MFVNIPHVTGRPHFVKGNVETFKQGNWIFGAILFINAYRVTNKLSDSLFSRCRIFVVKLWRDSQLACQFVCLTIHSRSRSDRHSYAINIS